MIVVTPKDIITATAQGDNGWQRVAIVPRASAQVTTPYSPMQLDLIGSNRCDLGGIIDETAKRRNGGLKLGCFGLGIELAYHTRRLSSPRKGSVAVPRSGASCSPDSAAGRAAQRRCRTSRALAAPGRACGGEKRPSDRPSKRDSRRSRRLCPVRVVDRLLEEMVRYPLLLRFCKEHGQEGI